MSFKAKSMEGVALKDAEMIAGTSLKVIGAKTWR